MDTKQFNFTVEMEYQDRRKHPVMIQPTIVIDGIKFYCHHEVKETHMNAICQILEGEMKNLENFKVRRFKKYVTTQVVEMNDTDLTDIRSAASED